MSTALTLFFFAASMNTDNRQAARVSFADIADG
jgi:hypothetical protein